MSRFSGYLLGFALDAERIERKALVKKGVFEYVGPLAGTRWERYVYCSNAPLQNEEREPEQVYRYPFVVRISGLKMAILGPSKDVANSFIKNHLNNGIVPKFAPISIKINELVELLVRTAKPYKLTYVHVWVSSYLNALNSISFYGDDIVEAELFRSSYEKFQCVNCGLREIENDSSEIIRLGTDGFISFRLLDAKRVDRVQAVLTYLSSKKFLETTGAW